MCGIAGFCFSEDSCLNARHLARALLNAIEERGREASGYAYPDADGMIVGNNAPLAARDFTASHREYKMDAAARVAILHTRLATKGSINNALNNHPVYSYADDGKAVAAVHNGGVWNDDECFDTFKLARYGQVDSEIIPAMIARYGSNDYAGIFNELTGGIATAWLDERVPGTLHMVRAWDSPMVLASIDVVDKLGLTIKGVIFASTVKALTAGLEALGLDWSMDGVRQFEIGEGEFLSCTNGEWDGLVYPFALPDMASRWGGSWRGKNRRTQGYSNLGWNYLYGLDDDEWEGTPTGIGSGKVETGKPSTYVAEPDGTLTPVECETDETPMALDDSIGGAEARADEGWWAEAIRMGEVASLANKRKDPGYVPTRDEMRVLATANDAEKIRLGLTLAEQREWNADYMWHMEICDTETCHFQNPDCPQQLDTEDLDALQHAAKVWGFASLVE